MRVVYLNLEAGLGGAERCLLDLTAALRGVAPEIDPFVITLSDGPLVDKLEELGVTVKLVPMPLSAARLGDSALYGGRAGAFAPLVTQAAKAVLPLRRHLHQLRDAITAAAPDVVHSNGNKTHMLTRLVCAEGLPTIWHQHDFIRRKPITAAALRWASPKCSTMIANSAAVAGDAAATLTGVAVDTIHNGVDVADFRPGAADSAERAALDDLAGLPPAPEITRVGLVATYARWKGHLFYLDAIARLPEAVRRATRFYIIGGPIYRTLGSQLTRAELRAEAVLRGVDVALVDFQENIAPLYRGLDVLVHASTEPEPFGRTIVEGMASALPVISTALGGARELFLPGVEGLAVSVGDAPGLAAAIENLLAHPERRRELGQRARRAALTRFSRERYAAKIVDVYRRHHGAPSRLRGAG